MRLSEIYRSVQGEGPRVGLPTTFVRFAGCNLRCPGWPCDTQHAIDPGLYRHEWKQVQPVGLADEILLMTPAGGNVCLTGGEPFLQPAQEMVFLIRNLGLGGCTVECFSNGTLEIPQDVFEDVEFIFDWKLPGSGETAVNANVFETNLHRAFESCYGLDRHAIKFTVADFADFEEATERWKTLKRRLKGNEPITFVAPVWGAVEPKELVGWLLDTGLPWRLNLQVHKMIWPEDMRGT